MTQTPQKPDTGSQMQLFYSAAEHYHNETNKLLDYFSKEYASPDPLMLMGQRFKDKEKEFASLRKENNDLKLEARNLHEQIDKLRLSLGGSISKDPGAMMYSVEEGIEFNRMTESVYPAKTTADTSDILSKLEEVEHMKEEARAEFKDMSKDYDELIEAILRHLNYVSHLNELREVAPSKQDSKGEGEQVLVHRHKYRQLVEVYAMSMSRAVMEELKEKNKSESVQVELGESKPVEFLEKYGGLLTIADEGTTDLALLFKNLAKRAGLSQEWERYHSEHQNEAVKKIQSIEKVLNYNREEDEAEQQARQEEMKERFLRKMNGLVESFEFTGAEKRYWSELRSRISEDRLYNAEGLVKLVGEGWKKEHRERADEMARMIESSITSALKGVEKIVSTRFKKPFLDDDSISTILGDGKELREELASGPDGEAIWEFSRTVLDRKMTESLEKVGRSLVFVSIGDLIRSRKQAQR